jgi:hypothetical protein
MLTPPSVLLLCPLRHSNRSPRSRPPLANPPQPRLLRLRRLGHVPALHISAPARAAQSQRARLRARHGHRRRSRRRGLQRPGALRRQPVQKSGPLAGRGRRRNGAAARAQCPIRDGRGWEVEGGKAGVTNSRRETLMTCWCMHMHGERYWRLKFMQRFSEKIRGEAICFVRNDGR